MSTQTTLPKSSDSSPERRVSSRSNKGVPPKFLREENAVDNRPRKRVDRVGRTSQPKTKDEDEEGEKEQEEEEILCPVCGRECFYREFMVYCRGLLWKICEVCDNKYGTVQLRKNVKAAGSLPQTIEDRLNEIRARKPNATVYPAAPSGDTIVVASQASREVQSSDSPMAGADLNSSSFAPGDARNSPLFRDRIQRLANQGLLKMPEQASPSQVGNPFPPKPPGHRARVLHLPPLGSQVAAPELPQPPSPVAVAQFLSGDLEMAEIEDPCTTFPPGIEDEFVYPWDDPSFGLGSSQDPSPEDSSAFIEEQERLWASTCPSALNAESASEPHESPADLSEEDWARFVNFSPDADGDIPMVQ